MAPGGTSLWRSAGLSYLQYVNKAAVVVRAATKEPLKSKIASRSEIDFAAWKWANGERGTRVDVDSIKKAHEAFKVAA
ncbi:hypothetical protein H257_04058 [Aphanomyces astaci]|uniref:ATP synthase subunit epsilon, mitochondrial n=2 Tax=Aphanomyces astaci TaxID=112090 RepID=W4GUD8_APHAT|nr:hypothetical protein H257_04058 [Aphanomyces astaci]ETV83302.1 hypothetical protein H257_04058 [Aphanomyces astaci]KAF0710093.1 hypothetical protein AaE_012653 [Aphanomyces astaci]RHY00741.1 hypothetical protein DYB36_003067 [Aphanomyces astaci]RHY28449.1 hypothetical protein DYB25_005854 [Aphanomyces astaci]RHY45505.1 hypothetical protein DYB34_006673 [Aphanomyces astaci]|eukprot:XP_009826732.1 hypothetical protein H257_04058 [Aphanomyces astaci]